MKSTLYILGSYLLGEWSFILLCLEDCMGKGVVYALRVLGWSRREVIYEKREYSHRLYSLSCGMDGTRTRDPLRDRQVF